MIRSLNLRSFNNVRMNCALLYHIELLFKIAALLDLFARIELLCNIVAVFVDKHLRPYKHGYCCTDYGMMAQHRKGN